MQDLARILHKILLVQLIKIALRESYKKGEDIMCIGARDIFCVIPCRTVFAGWSMHPYT